MIRSRAGLTGERTAPRDHALLALALATGLRAIELASLDVGDLSREWHAGQEEWWLVLPDSKTKGQSGGRTLPLAPELVQICATIWRSRDATGSAQKIVGRRSFYQEPRKICVRHRREWRDNMLVRPPKHSQSQRFADSAPARSA